MRRAVIQKSLHFSFCHHPEYERTQKFYLRYGRIHFMLRSAWLLTLLMKLHYHPLSTLYYYNAPDLTIWLTGDYHNRTYTDWCAPALLSTLPSHKKTHPQDHKQICEWAFSFKTYIELQKQWFLLIILQRPVRESNPQLALRRAPTYCHSLSIWGKVNPYGTLYKTVSDSIWVILNIPLCQAL